jgi:uncharacterized protein (TIGR01777 family)
MPVFERSRVFDTDRQTLFGYHAAPGALQRLIPPWERVEIAEQGTSLDVGTQVVLRQFLCGVPLKWIAQHTQLDAPTHFQDMQLNGPFARWQHDHIFESISENTSRLIDRVNYALPLGPAGRIAGGFIAKKIGAMFRYRHATTDADLRLDRFLKSNAPNACLRIGVTGSSGMIGRRIVDLISVLGHRPTRILRRQSSDRSMGYPPGTLYAVWHETGFDNVENVEGLDAVIHLAGKSIASGRWTEANKEAMHRSRVVGTQQLVSALRKLDSPPTTLVCASGVGYYGDQGNRLLPESAPSGSDYLASMAHDWEEAARVYERAGNRVAVGRLAMVLHPREGALAKLLPPFRFGLGGRMGSGQQYWPWIDIDDAAGAFLFLACCPNVEGAFNLAAPQVETNAVFASTLAKVLHRPNWLPAPKLPLRWMLGEMADAMLFSSNRVVPHRLLDAGFPFRSPTLEQCLRHLMGL